MMKLSRVYTPKASLPDLFGFRSIANMFFEKSCSKCTPQRNAIFSRMLFCVKILKKNFQNRPFFHAAIKKIFIIFFQKFRKNLPLR